MVTTFTVVMAPPFGANRTCSARDFMDGPLRHHLLTVHRSCQVGASAHLLLHPHHRAHHMATGRAFFAILSPATASMLAEAMAAASVCSTAAFAMMGVVFMPVSSGSHTIGLL